MTLAADYVLNIAQHYRTYPSRKSQPQSFVADNRTNTDRCKLDLHSLHVNQERHLFSV